MSVKIFLGTILLSVVVTVTGFAYWLFPILSRFNQAMGGPPMKNPSGDASQRLNAWLNFLPSDGMQRAIVIVAFVGTYLLWSTLATLIALQLRRRQEARRQRATARSRAMHAYNTQQ